MKTLTIAEIEMINGAGTNGNHGQNLGMAIGSIVDISISFFGAKADFTSAFGDMGLGIGLIIDFDFVTAATKLASGITAIVSAFGKDSSSPFLKAE